MAIGERIHFFRVLRGMTQKQLGMAAGFSERSADIRIAQYEKGTRVPKTNLTRILARILRVSPHALSVPDIDSDVGLAHTLFTLEDTCGLKVEKLDGRVCLLIDVAQGNQATILNKFLTMWQEHTAKLETGEITREEYDKWRYSYSGPDISQHLVRCPSVEVIYSSTK